MAVDLPIRCACGAFQAVAVGLSAERGNHGLCYCDDCQAFAHFLGRPRDILDAQGGTQVFHASPARLAILSGGEHLACMRLTPSGTLRWYARCCRWPIGNTLPTAKVPFVGLILPRAGRPENDPTLEQMLGPIRAVAFRRFASGDSAVVPRTSAPRFALAVLRFGRLLLRFALRGDAKRSPLFDARTGKPVVVPTVLAADERERLRHAS